MEDSSIAAVGTDYWPALWSLLAAHVYAGWSKNWWRKACKPFRLTFYSRITHDHASVEMADGNTWNLTIFLHCSWRQDRNVVLAALPNCARPIYSPPNALALGDIRPTRIPTARSAAAEAFHVYRPLASAVRNAAAQFGLNLDRAQISHPEKLFCRKPAQPTSLPFPSDEKNNFELADFVATNWRLGLAQSQGLTDERIWHMASFWPPRIETDLKMPKST